jgi:hypothetical protein
MPKRKSAQSRKNNGQLAFSPAEDANILQLAPSLNDVRRNEKVIREHSAAFVPSHKYKRTIEDLRSLASMFWPPELSQKEAELSIIPRLLETQDQFIAILSVDVPDLDNLFQVVNSSKLSANMLVKHLTVLADFGGEMLQRINSQFGVIFPSETLDYLWNGKRHAYKFKVLPVPGSLSNTRLGITGKRLLEKLPLTELLQDVIVLLIFGSACVDENAAQILSKCEIGNYLGQSDKLTKFIKQRYIMVSRITAGSQSNSLGQIAQSFVKEYLQAHFEGLGVVITTNGHLPKVTHTDELTNRPTSFDIVVSKDNKYLAVEVSFQVTTNSVIERKAGQARARYEQIENAGHKIAYVIDGAGNFQRENAINILCSYSHCTVAFSLEELNVLCDFIIEYLKL